MITLFIGRFQPFHLGHLQDIRFASIFSDKIKVGIGSSNEENTIDNPFSFIERKEMIENTVRKEISDLNYDILSIPDIHDDTLWIKHVQNIVGEFDILFTGNPKVKELALEKEINVRDVTLFRGISGNQIRKSILKGRNWQEYVPSEVSSFIKKIEGVNRIKKINGSI